MHSVKPKLLFILSPHFDKNLSPTFAKIGTHIQEHSKLVVPPLYGKGSKAKSIILYFFKSAFLSEEPSNIN